MNISYIMLFMMIVLQNNAHSVYSLNKLLKCSFADTEWMMQLGNHIIAEFLECEQNLDAFEYLEQVLREAALKANATVIQVVIHKFCPQGMSAIVLLAESHISIHTWPEYGYVAIDVYTCGKHVDTHAVIDVLKSFFKPKKIHKVLIDRGYDAIEKEVNATS